MRRGCSSGEFLQCGLLLQELEVIGSVPDSRDQADAGEGDHSSTRFYLKKGGRDSHTKSGEWVVGDRTPQV
jgi:hypothetical protein